MQCEYLQSFKVTIVAIIGFMKHAKAASQQPIVTHLLECCFFELASVYEKQAIWHAVTKPTQNCAKCIHSHCSIAPIIIRHHKPFAESVKPAKCEQKKDMDLKMLDLQKIQMDLANKWMLDLQKKRVGSVMSSICFDKPKKEYFAFVC